MRLSAVRGPGGGDRRRRSGAGHPGLRPELSHASDFSAARPRATRPDRVSGSRSSRRSPTCMAGRSASRMRRRVSPPCSPSPAATRRTLLNPVVTPRTPAVEAGRGTSCRMIVVARQLGAAAILAGVGLASVLLASGSGASQPAPLVLTTDTPGIPPPSRGPAEPHTARRAGSRPSGGRGPVERRHADVRGGQVRGGILRLRQALVLMQMPPSAR